MKRKILLIAAVLCASVVLPGYTNNNTRFIQGRYASYLFYKRDLGGGNKRVTLKIYNRKSNVIGDIDADLIRYNIYSNYIPSAYKSTVYKQIACHGIGGIFIPKAEWNIELQRNQQTILDLTNKCNTPSWIDNNNIDWILDSSIQPYSTPVLPIDE